MASVTPAMVLLFFAVAAVYSSMGFGGGSSYLAVMVLMGFPYQEIPPIALVCNLVVTGTAFVHFAASKHFEFKKVLPFVVLSIPMAYLGGRASIPKEVFCLLLGGSLSAVGVRMLLSGSAAEVRVCSTRVQWLVGLPLGGTIGFISGLIGIGGGIFLSPVLLLIRWADVKQAAAAASFFIFVNSCAALLGHLHKAPLHAEGLLTLATAVFIGGQLGSPAGAVLIPKVVMQRMLGLFVLYASFKLFWSAL